MIKTDVLVIEHGNGLMVNLMVDTLNIGYKLINQELIKEGLYRFTFQREYKLVDNLPSLPPGEVSI